MTEIEKLQEEIKQHQAEMKLSNCRNNIDELQKQIIEKHNLLTQLKKQTNKPLECPNCKQNNLWIPCSRGYTCKCGLYMDECGNKYI